MKKLWKNNKIAVLFTIVILVIIITVLLIVFPLYSTRSGSTYGNRLDGIEDVAISSNTDSKIEEIFTNTSKIDKIDIFLKGKIYNIFVYVKDEVNVNDLIPQCDEALKVLDEEQIKYYDIQFFIKNSGENAKTIVGYKNKSSKGISWTNNK